MGGPRVAGKGDRMDRTGAEDPEAVPPPMLLTFRGLDLCAGCPVMQAA